MACAASPPTMVQKVPSSRVIAPLIPVDRTTSSDVLGAPRWRVAPARPSIASHLYSTARPDDRLATRRHHLATPDPHAPQHAPPPPRGRRRLRRRARRGRRYRPGRREGDARRHGHPAGPRHRLPVRRHHFPDILNYSNDGIRTILRHTHDYFDTVSNHRVDFQGEFEGWHTLPKSSGSYSEKDGNEQTRDCQDIAENVLASRGEQATDYRAIVLLFNLDRGISNETTQAPTAMPARGSGSASPAARRAGGRARRSGRTRSGTRSGCCTRRSRSAPTATSTTTSRTR